MLHVIYIIARHNDHFDIKIFNEHRVELTKYSIIGLNAIQAYVYVRGLMQLFASGLDRYSEAAYTYAKTAHDLQQRQN